MPRARWRAALPGLPILALLGGTACVTRGMVVTPPAHRAAAVVADARSDEERLVASDLVYEDADVVEYLETVVDRLLSEDERGTEAAPITIAVLRDPTLSAFTLSTGRMFLHTGLLARLENEAQLAMVLARELAHLARRQALDSAASESPLTAALAGMAPTITRALATAPGADESTSSLVSPVARAILGGRLLVAYVAAVDGYGAAAAREADAGAVTRLQRAGYAPREAARAFERLRREAHAGGAAERFFYGNDAALAERIAGVARLVANSEAPPAPGAGPAATTEAFARRVATVRRDNARLEVRAGRFRLAHEQLDQAQAAHAADAMIHLVYGDLARLRAQRARSVADRDELLRSAVASYERCLALDPSIAQVHRQLGLLYYQLRQLDAAQAAFARYVALAPDAPDAARAREYLPERGQGGPHR